ncbi:MAG: class I SAM-dependent methyltransferase [Gammaproteobacteria bacterium]
MSRDSYDKIAAVYSTDMGLSMAFDDVGYYRRLCSERGGHTLELGCGTGRILLPLLQSGIDIAGVDESPGMLAQLRINAKALNLHPSISSGSLTSFSSPPCHTVLAPYSVVTYLADTSQLADFFLAVRRVLTTDGMLVLDTFIPRPVSSYTEFRLDYRREHEGGILQREKRITVEAGCNRIERRYSLLELSGVATRTWTTVDVIRPWQVAELLPQATACGLTLVAQHGNFTGTVHADDQFVQLHWRATGTS